MRLEIPNPNAPGTGEQVASRFAPRAAPRISSMCYLTTEPELRTHEIESKVSEVIQGINDGIENLDQFCLMMMMSDDIDKLLLKLSVNQEILAGLLLKPFSKETRIAIRMRATFGESLYQRIRSFISPHVEECIRQDRKGGEKTVRLTRSSTDRHREQLST